MTILFKDDFITAKTTTADQVLLLLRLGAGMQNHWRNPTGNFMNSKKKMKRIKTNLYEMITRKKLYFCRY